jgi:hypothetical protein
MNEFRAVVITGILTLPEGLDDSVFHLAEDALALSITEQELPGIVERGAPHLRERQECPGRTEELVELHGNPPVY